MINNLQRGVSLYITVIILTIILSSVLGLSAILIAQIKMVRSVSYSVTALFAADTGIEIALKAVYEDPNTIQFLPPSGDLDPNNGSPPGYELKVVCCQPGTPKCLFLAGECSGLGLLEDPTCQAKHYCIRSVGDYKDTKRAIEAKIN